MNKIPVIGILAHPYKWNELQDPLFICAAYIKWLEFAGARTLAIPVDAPFEVLDDLFTQIHMLFLPGGDLDYPVEFLNYVLDKVVEHNKKGFYFPVWGTCLGFQQIVDYVSTRGKGSLLTWEHETAGISWPLEQVKMCELYKDPAICKAVTGYGITFHNNRGGISPENFLANPNLNEMFHITSINHDKKGQAYVTTIEPKHPETFPFYAVQYHPEKNTCEYGFFPGMPGVPYQPIDHSTVGIAFSFGMAEFVVNLARKSLQSNGVVHQYTKAHLYPPMCLYPTESQPPFAQIYIVPRYAEKMMDDNTGEETASSVSIQDNWG